MVKPITENDFDWVDILKSADQPTNVYRAVLCGRLKYFGKSDYLVKALVKIIRG